MRESCMGTDGIMGKVHDEAGGHVCGGQMDMNVR